jgi:hypothetical protein
LHDTTQPRWQAADIRRYAYWSIFAGACGFTYGHNSIMQFKRIGDTNVAYGADKNWQQAMNATGANEMQYVVKLMQSVVFETAKPFQDIVKNSGDKYERLAALQGKNFAFVYTYNGKNIEVDMNMLDGKKSKAFWYNPRNGDKIFIETINNSGVHAFNPPGDKKDGNDWILILEKI